MGLGRPEPSGVDTMSDVSVAAAVGGLLSLGGGGSVPVADAQDVEATAVHVDIISKAGGNDNEQGLEAGKETSDPPVANKKRKRNGNGNKTCNLPGCGKYAQSGKEGYCCAHHTELVLGVWRKSCKLEGCEKEARPEKGMEGYCQAHHTEFVLGAVKPKITAARKTPKTRGRTCSVPGCPKQVQQGGLCCRHGARSTRGMCRHNGCTNASKRGGLCRRHGAFDLNTCARKGCRHVAVQGNFCNIHTEGCVEAGCRAAATSGYYCQRHYVKPPPRKAVVTGGNSKGKGIKRARKIKKAKAEESDDDEDYDPSEEEYCRPVKKRQASPRKHRYGTRGIRVSLPPPTPPTSEDEDEEEEKEEEMPSFSLSPEGSICNIHTKSVEAVRRKQ
ncbi:hypothetical protein ACHAXT_009236 [Thalassiosira profunda]